MNLKVIAIVGPTAVGKSDLAVKLAQNIPAEIINADAMQLYKGMDIGTAKISEKIRNEIKHHLIDVLNPSQEASVSVYQKKARAIIKEIQEKNRTPILVGGSGLYINAVLEDLDFPGTNLEVRAKYEEYLESYGIQQLFEELKKVDPEAASNILPNNARRIVRALEVNEITGKPFNAKLPDPKPIYDDVRIGLNLDREILDQKISIRVHNMFQDGLVDEVKNILDLITAGKTSQKALGYSQVIDFLKGNISIEEAIEQTISATKKYARRQISWFKRDPLLRWFQADDIKLEQEIIRMVS